MDSGLIPAARSSAHRLALLGVSLSVSLLLSGCGAGSIGDLTANAGDMFNAQSPGNALNVTMFVASTRKDDSTDSPEGGLRYSMSMISVPPGHTPGNIESPTFGKPNVKKHFVIVGGSPMSGDRFRNEIATHLSGRVGSNRDILLYVHGFNTSADEARFRLSQIVADGRFGGVPVLFTWPSKSNLFSYVSDKDSATASRDAVAKVMKDLADTPGIGRIHILAHSMGTWLAMEALRENAIGGAPDLNGRLGDVMLAAPDIDLTVFKQQISRLDGRAHVSIFVSRADRALSMSSRLAGDRQRVGALDPTNARDRSELDRLGVKVYDVSSFSGGFVGHGVYADAPDVIRTIGAHLAEPRKDDASSVAVINADGGRMSVPPPAPPMLRPELPPLDAAVTSQPLPPLADGAQ